MIACFIRVEFYKHWDVDEVVVSLSLEMWKSLLGPDHFISCFLAADAENTKI